MGKEAAAISLEAKQSITGEELFRRYHEGDDDSFNALVALYENDLARFINGIVRDYHEAKHLTIEAFAQLAVNGGRYSGKSSVRTYLFTIGKNLAVKYMKMRGKEQHISFEDVVEILVVEGGDTPDGHLEREDDKRLVRETMRCLKDEHRVVLMLLYFEDMSYRTAGKVMHKTEKQIKDMAYRAKAALKRKLEIGGYEYGR